MDNQRLQVLIQGVARDIDGLARTVNLAETCGSTCTSGALIFGGGDS